MTPILGFAPDSDPTTPGIATDCEHWIPYEAGFKGAPSPVMTAVTALAAEARGAAVVTKLDGTRRIFAGTQTKLYEVATGVWTDRSRAGNYTGSSESRWTFAQFGDTTIATNRADAMQSSTTGAFADLAGAPKALIVVSASNNFVLAFNTDEATYGNSTDRWWCSAQSDATNWTPSVSTSSATGRLVAVEGPIQAAGKLGDYVVAYKKRAIFVGVFVGAPIVWQWNLIPGGEAGAVGLEAVCDIGGAHFIVGDDNFWLFDGTRPQPLGMGEIRQWFLDNSSPLYRYRAKATYDKQSNLVRVNYASNRSTGVCDACLVFHVFRKKWGCNDVTIEAPLNYVTPGVTIDGMDTYASTIDALPAVPLDSQFWLAGGQVPTYFNSAHQLVSMSGPTGDSSFTTGDLGDDDMVSELDQFRVRYTSQPATASATGFHKMSEGQPLTAGPINAINDGKFDLRQSARFHRVRVDMTGDHKETAFRGKPIPDGWR